MVPGMARYALMPTTRTLFCTSDQWSRDREVQSAGCRGVKASSSRDVAVSSRSALSTARREEMWAPRRASARKSARSSASIPKLPGEGAFTDKLECHVVDASVQLQLARYGDTGCPPVRLE